MSAKKIRLLKAGRVLHSLEIQIEQYRLHLDQLAGQPYEEEKARAMLNRMSALLESQRTYCNPSTTDHVRRRAAGERRARGVGAVMTDWWMGRQEKSPAGSAGLLEPSRTPRQFEMWVGQLEERLARPADACGSACPGRADERGHHP